MQKNKMKDSHPRNNSIIYYPFNPAMEDIVSYSYKLSKHLHEGEERQNGKSYFDAHSVPIVQRFEKLDFHPLLLDILKAIGYLHDVIENNLEVKIRSPFDSVHEHDEFTINSLFQLAGTVGTKVLYGVNRLTDKFKNKFEYMNSLLAISASNTWHKNLDLGILALKTCDIWENNRDPHETYKNKNNSEEEKKNARLFMAKKLRRGLELKYHYLSRIETTLFSYADIKIQGEPLFNPSKIEELIREINLGFEGFVRLNPPLQIVLSNDGLGDMDARKLPFYTMAFKRLSEDYSRYFNCYELEPLSKLMRA